MIQHRMFFRSSASVAVAGVAAVLLFLFAGSSPSSLSFAQSSNAAPHCVPIGGTVMTNLGVVDRSTTLGIVDGDLKGAVAATILNVAPGSGGTQIFAVQHHFVTQAGDTILVDQATATTREVVPNSGLYAILDYPVHIKGGTRRFAGATGDSTTLALPIWAPAGPFSVTAGKSASRTTTERGVSLFGRSRSPADARWEYGGGSRTGGLVRQAKSLSAGER